MDQAGAILELEDVGKWFGGLLAVHDLSFAVRQGAITTLIGGNGAGKTTVFNLITGFLKPDKGTIRFRGRSLDGLPAERVARAGISRGFQELRLFNRLQASDNVLVAFPGQRGEGLIRALLGGPALRSETRRNAARGRALLASLSLEPDAATLAEQLSYGQQKLLALGRLLAAEGELLLLDEPTSGLGPSMVDDFCARMRRLVEDGKTILLIEHNFDIVMRVSDWVVVMHQGTKIAEGPPEEIRRNLAVMHAYLGIAP
jgi:ABC-type branched-subunit amino acid transport system ATPase component